MMSKLQCFGIIGGDQRQLYCGRSMEEDGYSVNYCGFSKKPDGFHLTERDMLSVIRQSDALLLPLPCTRDGMTIHAPLSEQALLIDELSEVFGQKPVFCGMKKLLPFTSSLLYDYSEREEFAVENAVPTSEGAIECAMHHYEGTIQGSRCLVIGYGRIGRILSSMLRGLGADVTVSARSLRDRAYIRSCGMKEISSAALCGQYVLIFNTVPVMLLHAQVLAKIAAHALVIDLASLPGGVDFEAARRLSIPAIHALSLPGKVAPKASGIIIKNAVYNIIREEGL